MRIEVADLWSSVVWRSKHLIKRLLSRGGVVREAQVGKLQVAVTVCGVRLKGTH